MLVSSWDKHVYLYDTQDQEAGGKLIEKYEHRAPVLDICFGADDNEAFSAGMDWQVKRYGSRCLSGQRDADIKLEDKSQDRRTDGIECTWATRQVIGIQQTAL